MYIDSVCSIGETLSVIYCRGKQSLAMLQLLAAAVASKYSIAFGQEMSYSTLSSNSH